MLSHLSHTLDSPHIQIGKEVLQTGAKKLIETIRNHVLKSKSIGDILSHKNLVDSMQESGVNPNGLVTFRIFLISTGFAISLGEKNIGAFLMTLSCLLDASDGKLARDHNMKSKEGEIYDPLSDKISEVFLSVSSLTSLNPSQFATQVSLLIPKLWFHYKSQFNEKRGSFKEQICTIKKIIIEGDKNTKYLENITLGAANTAGKWKTGLQFTSGLGLIWLHTSLAQTTLEYLLKTGVPVTIEEVNDFLTWAFISAGIASLPFAVKSIYGRKDGNKTEILDEKTLQMINDSDIQKNPYFLPLLGGGSVGIFYTVSEFINRIKNIVP